MPNLLMTNLKKLLNAKRMTSAQLSRATKIPPQTLNNWLSGQSPRNLDHVKKVADYFNVTIDYLLYGNEFKSKESLEDFSEEINAGIFEVVLRRVKK